MGMSEIQLAELEDILASYTDLIRIAVGKDDVITFSLGPTNLEMVEKENGSQKLQKPIPLGEYDIVIAPGTEEPLIRNRTVRRTYGKIKGKDEILIWDHPHILNMRVQSKDYLGIISPLITSENWEQMIVQTVMFLTSATIKDEMSLKILKIWNQDPTEEESVSVSVS